MAFKTVEQFNEERFGDFFLLRNDGDFADVVFLYENINQALVAEAHYIKSEQYSGYVHCCGRGCPACGKNIRVQTKLFIPVFNMTTGKVEFWDRTIRFEPQLRADVFKNYPNPSQVIFRITRHGAAGDVNTTYEITAMGWNKDPKFSYAHIMATNNLKFPDMYGSVCKEVTASEMYNMLNQGQATSSQAPSSGSALPDYQVRPRGVNNAPTVEPPAAVLPVEDTDTADDGITPLDEDEVVF